jgi:hypothetical protein
VRPLVYDEERGAQLRAVDLGDSGVVRTIAAAARDDAGPMVGFRPDDFSRPGALLRALRRVPWGLPVIGCATGGEALLALSDVSLDDLSGRLAFVARGSGPALSLLVKRYVALHLRLFALNRIECNVTASQLSARPALEAAGFMLEGVWQQAAFVGGAFEDVSCFGRVRALLGPLPIDVDADSDAQASCSWVPPVAGAREPTLLVESGDAVVQLSVRAFKARDLLVVASAEANSDDWVRSAVDFLFRRYPARRVEVRIEDPTEGGRTRMVVVERAGMATSGSTSG